MPHDVVSQFRTDEKGNPAGGITEGVGLSIIWQNGPIVGGVPNGASLEAAIEAVIQRLEFLNEASNGRFSCKENSEAIRCLRSADTWMQVRTRGRVKRGVEGSHRP